MAEADENRIVAEICTQEHDPRLAQFTILGGLILQAEALEEQALGMRATIDAIIKEPFAVPADQAIRVKTEHPNGLLVSVLQAGTTEDNESVAFWRQVQDLDACSDTDYLRQGPEGDWRFYGQSIRYDERTKQVWVYSNDETARVLYRDDTDELTCVQRPNLPAETG